MKIHFKCLFVVFAFFGFALNVYAQSHPDELIQMVEQLQKSPGDDVLREKLIDYSHKIKPVPAIPEEARRYLARGIAAFENAKSLEDFKLAIPEFQRAANSAPWWSDTYFNLAKVQEKIGDYKGAISNYRLYLLADPKAKDAESIRTQSYKLEFLAEQKAKADDAAATAHAREDQRRQQSENVLNQLKQLVGGANFDRGDCHTALVAGADGALFADGCTWYEYQGRNWQSDHALEGNFVFDFSDDGMVRLGFKGFGRSVLAFTDLIGTPNGPTLSDIKWECLILEWNGAKNIEKGRKTAWARLSSDGRWIGWTCETADPSVNPATKYHYSSYSRQ